MIVYAYTMSAYSSADRPVAPRTLSKLVSRVASRPRRRLRRIWCAAAAAGAGARAFGEAALAPKSMRPTTSSGSHDVARARLEKRRAGPAVATCVPRLERRARRAALGAEAEEHALDRRWLSELSRRHRRRRRPASAAGRPSGRDE